MQLGSIDYTDCYTRGQWQGEWRKSVNHKWDRICQHYEWRKPSIEVLDKIDQLHMSSKILLYRITDPGNENSLSCRVLTIPWEVVKKRIFYSQADRKQM